MVSVCLCVILVPFCQLVVKPGPPKKYYRDGRVTDVHRICYVLFIRELCLSVCALSGISFMLCHVSLVNSAEMAIGREMEYE